MSDMDACAFIDEWCDDSTSKVVVARKPHICCECDGEIIVGERHEHLKMLWDDNWTSYRTCAACLRGPLAFSERNCAGSGRMVEGLFEHLQYVLDDGLLATVYAEGQVMRWLDESRGRRLARRSK